MPPLPNWQPLALIYSLYLCIYIFPLLKTGVSHDTGVTVPTSDSVGQNDLLIVGPGVLGRIVADKWQQVERSIFLTFVTFLLFCYIKEFQLTFRADEMIVLLKDLIPKLMKQKITHVQMESSFLFKLHLFLLDVSISPVVQETVTITLK